MIRKNEIKVSEWESALGVKVGMQEPPPGYLSIESIAKELNRSLAHTTKLISRAVAEGRVLKILVGGATVRPKSYYKPIK